MGDIENELDSVLDRYQKKQVETRKGRKTGAI